MYVSDELPPAWIDDDGQVGRRIVRRRYDTAGPDVWWRVAEAIRQCRTLFVRPPDSPLRLLAHANAALRNLNRAAILLPPPMPPCYEAWLPLWQQPLDELLEWGPRPELVATLATALCGELDDADWTCPDRLAGLVDDLRVALGAYQAEVVRLFRHERSVAG